jgi:hypothetical protein
MNIIGYIIFITVVITLFYIFLIFGGLFIYLVADVIAGEDGAVISKKSKHKILDFLNEVGGKILPVYIYILVFYIIFYFLYLFIITVIPPTGFATFFIPIRELLLKIPPFPDLIEYGVFKLIGRLFEIFKINGMFKKFVKTNEALLAFSNDNIKIVLSYLFPSFKNNIDNFVNNVNIDKFNNFTENKREGIYKKIENDTNICVANNIIPIVPNMSASERVTSIYKNQLTTVKCHANSIGSYVKTNY